ncbi:MAG: histidine phosphatase family protein [Pseudomonadota bacterium]
MSGNVLILTHADVVIEPLVPVPDWGLSETGRARHAAFAETSDLSAVTAVYASTEQKARDGAAPIARGLGLPVQTREALGENDRSATGFLPPEEFWPVVDAFFARPETSTRGWETAKAAQDRIVGAVKNAIDEAPAGDIVIVSHGGVGNLLRCALLGKPISRDEDQPHPKGGCWFAFPRNFDAALTDWNTI